MADKESNALSDDFQRILEDLDDSSESFDLEPPLISLLPATPMTCEPGTMETSLVEVIQDLVNFEVSPATAAQRIDDLIFDEHRDPEDPAEIVVDTSEEARNRDPSVRAWFVLDYLPIIVTQVPADHPGLERLVLLLKELERRPSRKITLKPKGGSRDEDLWSKINDHQHGFVQESLIFWESRIFSWNPHWHCLTGSTAALESYSAFSAKLFIMGFYSMDCCAVTREPFATAIFNGHWRRPLTVDLEPFACSAAQWILFAGAQLYEMCHKKAGLRPQTWIDWRTKFERVSTADQLSDRCRIMASRAVEIMKQIERDGVTTNVVDEYGMSYLDGDTIVSNCPESRSYIGKRSQWNEYAEDGKP